MRGLSPYPTQVAVGLNDAPDAFEHEMTETGDPLVIAAHAVVVNGSELKFRQTA
jgi:hypothetical protein